MPGTVVRRIPVLMALVLACGHPATAAAQAPPGLPGFQSERFRVVVEGNSSAVTDLDLAAATEVCAWEMNVHLTETATYQRGRGLVVQFTRLGSGPNAPVIVQRPGRAGATFEVVVKATRQSTGSASRRNATAADICVPVTESLTGGPECGTPQPVPNTKLEMTFKTGVLRLKRVGLGGVAEIKCPVSQVLGGTPELELGWPDAPVLRPAPIPLAQIFGTRRVIVVRTVSDRVRRSGPFTSGGLSGSATHFGVNRATIRLVRLP